MKRFLAFALVAFLSPFEAECGKSYDFHYLRTVKMNDSEDLYEYEIKSIDKLNETTFNVNFQSDLKVDLNDEWHMWIDVYHNPEFKEEFEKPYFSVPKTNFCKFMSTTYKDRLYPYIKDHSNLPPPDQCPVKAGHFEITGCPFNLARYQVLAKEGLWRVDLFLSQDHEDSHVTKIGKSIYSEVKVLEE